MINEAIKLENNLCLLVAETTFILYRKSIKGPMEEYDYEAMEDEIVAVAITKDSTHGSWEVDSAWARGGYGPTLYLIIMDMAGSNGLMPNVNIGMVSNDAKRVWKEFYDGKGSEYVSSKVQIEGEHLEDHMNNIFYTDFDTKYRKMQRNSDKVIGHDPYGEFRDLIWEAGSSLLTSTMRGIYASRLELMSESFFV